MTRKPDRSSGVAPGLVLQRAMTAAAENGALIGLWFVGQKYYPATLTPWVCEPDYPVFTALRRWLSRYFSGTEGRHDLRLAPHGSPFPRE